MHLGIRNSDGIYVVQSVPRYDEIIFSTFHSYVNGLIIFILNPHIELSL